MELIKHRDCYDMQDPPTMTGTIAYDWDDCILHDPYHLLLRSVTTPGSCSEMMLVYSASAALSVVIMSYCPPANNVL